MLRISFKKIKFPDEINPVKFFVIAATTFGLAFAVITPPFQTPDEPAHFYRAYQVSSLNFIPDKVGNHYGGLFPKAVQDAVTDTATNPIIKHSANIKYDIYKTKKAYLADTKTKNQTTEIYNLTSYSAVSYLPQAMGIGLGRTLNLPPVALMYIARLMNLLLWITLLALSIKLIPRKKWALAAIALLPMALFQAISLNVDVMAVGILTLTLSWALRLKNQNTKISTKIYILLLFLLSALALSKQIMFIFLPLILLLPNNLFGGRVLFKKTGLIAVPVFILVLSVLSSQHVKIENDPLNSPNPALQASFMAHNPHSFINVLWNTYFFTWGDSITGSFIGNFGWQDTPLAGFLVIIGYMSLLFLMLTNYSNPKQWLKKHEKLFVLFIGSIYWLAVSAALYIYYSPVGYKIIVGLQGRYYLPLAILLVPLLHGNWLRTTRPVYMRVAILAPLFLLSASAITIYVRYYVNNV